MHHNADLQNKPTQLIPCSPSSTHALTVTPLVSSLLVGSCEDDGSYAAQGIFIDPARRLIIASNGNWISATE